jgi:hypothetical protein
MTHSIDQHRKSCQAPLPDRLVETWIVRSRRNHLAALALALIVMAVFVFAGASAFAQTAANLDGLVHDPTGALIPKVKVELRNTGNGVVRNTLTNSTGMFTFPGLETGDYALHFEAEGFQPTEYTGIHLNPGDQRTLRDVKLSVVKSEAVSITVTSETGEVSTDSGETSTLISASDLEHMATEGRDVTELLKVLPGMAINPSSSSDYSNRAYDPSVVAFQGAIGNYSANGTQTNSTALLYDNMDITDPGSYGIAIQNVNSEQIAEFKAQTGSFTADTAHGPVVINNVGKSGGKDYHGSLYVHGRTNQLNSLDWLSKYYSLTPPTDRQIYPGFTIGGPLVIPHVGFTHSKKLTFFVGGEAYEQRNIYAYNSASSASYSALVPTAAMRNGDFSSTALLEYLGPYAKYDSTAGKLNCTASLTNASYSTTSVLQNICTIPTIGPSGGTTIVNGDVSANVDPLGVSMLKSLPLPNVQNSSTRSSLANYYATDFVNSNLIQVRGRIDYALSDRTQMFISYGLETGKQYQPSSPYGRNSPNGMGGQMDTPGGGFVDTITSHVASFRVTSVLSPSLTNEFYAGGAYFSQPFNLRNPSAVLNNPYQFVFANGSKAMPSAITWGSSTYGGMPFMSVEDGTWGGNFSKKQMRLAGDNVTKLLGRHTLRAGIFYQWVTNPQKQQGQYTNGQISDYYHPSSFSEQDGGTGYSTGNYVSDLYEGVIGGFAQENKKIETNLYFYNLSWYAQDHWLVGRKLSIDAGIRFEHLAPWTDPHGLGLAVFDPTAYASGSPTSSPGVVYHGIDRSIPMAGVPTRSVFYEPRAGFALDVRGDSKMILRGGYGLYRQHDSYNDTYQAAQTAQGQRSYSMASSGHTFAKLNQWQTAVTNSAGFTSDVDIYTHTVTDDEMPEVQTYNLMLDQRLPHNALFELGYVGNHANHLVENSSLRNINAIAAGTLFKPFPDSGRTDMTQYVGHTADFFNTINGIPPLTNMTTAEIDSFRTYPLYSHIYALRHRAFSNYNGMQATVLWRPKHGEIRANYTWSKALGAINGPDPININNDYLPLSMDRRHIFNINYYYGFGKLVNQKLLGGIVNGWSISGYAGLQGGPIMNSNMSLNFGLTATLTVPAGTTVTVPGHSTASTCTPSSTATSQTCSVSIGSNQIIGSYDYTLMPTVVGNPRGNTAAHQYVNGSAFRLPTVGTNGPSYLGAIRGPDYFNSDIAMSKTFTAYRKNTLELRIASFNFLNRANYSFTSLAPTAYGLNFSQSSNYSNLNDDLSNATNQQSDFGTTKLRAGRRVLEVSAKYRF